jgi:hypothetical protein
MVESGFTFALKSPSASKRLENLSSPIRKVHPEGYQVLTFILKSWNDYQLSFHYN